MTRRPLTVLGFALAAASALWSSACAPLQPITPTTEPWTNYKLNQQQRAAIGATMIEWIGEGDLLPGYCVEIPVGRKGTNLLSDRGTVWAAMYTYHGKDCPGATYLVVNRTYYQSQLGYLVSVDGQIPCVKAQMRATGAKGGLTYEVSVPPGTQAFRPCAATPVVGRKAPTKWELVYSGRSGDEIQLSYREYDDYGIAQVARPAFYQDLQYDLGKGSRITFRNTMIEVLDANNSGITFKVVAH